MRSHLHPRIVAMFMLCISAIVCGLSAPATPKQPVELGRVKWLTDYDGALKTAQQSHKPVFLLFQEIPGCQGCKDFGAAPLSHPLLVEAIDSDFTPVVIHNNR